jgi:hypothetical protein
MQDEVDKQIDELYKQCLVLEAEEHEKALGGNEDDK